MLPLFAIVSWRMPRFIVWHVALAIACWAIAIGGALELDAAWPLLVLFGPLLAFPVFERAKGRLGRNAP